MRIKVLHIVLSLGTGGLENGVVNTINGSDQEKFQIDVLCLRSMGELSSRIENKNTTVFFDDRLGNGLLGAVKAIRKLNAANGYHIIHTHGWATMLAGYIAGRLERNPMVINGEHGTLYYRSFQQRFIQKFLFNHVDLNLSVSAALVGEISRKFNVTKDRFKPILNGVDVNKFKPNEEARNLVRISLGLSESDLLVGSVGRLVTVKNYPSLIRAFSLVNQKLPKAKLVLAGDGPLLGELRALAEQLEISQQVVLLGRRDDIPDVMNALDLFVLPSFREGLSNTILEAMASGLPAIVSNVGGSPEIVIENQTGFLFEVDDIQRLSEILCSLLSNDIQRREISRKARDHVVANYSIDKMVSNYQNTYVDLIQQRGVCI